MAKLFELENAATLKQELQEVVEQARATCDLNGGTSPECAAGWDAAEEIQATIAHRKSSQTTFEVYCDQHPDAAECRIYDV
jgi:hypothetical protein